MKEINCDEDDDSYTADQITIEVGSVNGDDSLSSDSCDGTWTSIATAGTGACMSSNNISVVRKPQLVKFKQCSRDFHEIVKIKHKRRLMKNTVSKSKLRRMAEPQLRPMNSVVTDVPEKGNKLKQPGPFQAANRVICSNAPSAESLTWFDKVSKGRTGLESRENESAASQQQTRESVLCAYCNTHLSTQLEADLHIIAQHKHEKTLQDPPLSCLESGCLETCSSVYALKQHLILGHEIQLQHKFLTFQHMKEFTSWKQELESASGTRFLFFSKFAEVSGSITRVYICNNEGHYDLQYAKLTSRQRQRRRRGSSGALVIAPRARRKGGRACPAQLLVRSWGWGAIEVDAQLSHYGHAGADSGRPGMESVRSSPMVLQRPPLPVQPLVKREEVEGVAGGGHKREEGVRIIEGSLLGQRGMDNLQTDLTRWDLVENVSICVCKRRHDVDTQGILEYEDFALGFSTSEQLDTWAGHGGRVVCVDSLQVMTPACEGLSVSAVVVLGPDCEALPVAWLIASRYSEALFRHFLMCLRVAYESFHSCSVPVPRSLVCEASSQLLPAWQEVLEGGARDAGLLVARWEAHKTWMPRLREILSPRRRQAVWEELSSILRSSSSTPRASLRIALRRLAVEADTSTFARHVMDTWLPSSDDSSATGTPLQQHAEEDDYEEEYPDHQHQDLCRSGGHYGVSLVTGVYLDIMQPIFSFLYVEEEFSSDFDECVYKLNKFTSTMLECSKVSDSPSMRTTQLPLCSPGRPRNGCVDTAWLDGHSTSRLSQLTAVRHRQARLLGAEDVCSVSPHSWQVSVQAGTQGNERHTVTRRRPHHSRRGALTALKSICSQDCTRVCQECAVCVHQYMCTCPDSLVLSVVCVHVHLIRILMRDPQHVRGVPDTPPLSLHGGLSSAYKTEESLKVDIRSKCLRIINILKCNGGSVSNDIAGDEEERREYLLQCDQQLDAMISRLRPRVTPRYRRPVINPLTNGSVSDRALGSTTEENGTIFIADQGHVYYSGGDDTATVLSPKHLHPHRHAATSIAISARAVLPEGDGDGAACSSSLSAVTSAVVSSSRLLAMDYSGAAGGRSDSLEDELDPSDGGGEELLVLHEEDGRYSLVSRTGSGSPKQEMLYLSATEKDVGEEMLERDGEERTMMVLRPVSPTDSSTGLR